MCGENAHRSVCAFGYFGSSPRVRGKPAWATRAGVHSGLIPACAGKTIKTPTVTKLCRAHPRVCGENYDKVKAEFFAEGSSPRVRGKQPAGRQPPPGLGLITACAGKTRYGMDSQPLKRAHPRVCGENSFGLLAVAGVVGSSPRVRGKLIRTSCCCGRGGLIPACAGKTSSYAQTASGTRAHPRVCGENLESQSDKVHDAGSSPRVRGKHRDFRRCSDAERLIPACAGKTELWERANIRSGAHPRVCGENARQTRDFAAQWGSSPRVRGKLGLYVASWNGCGLIPACAGKTLNDLEF